MTERRSTRRYDLSLPIIVRVPAERTLDSQQGKTRDISTRGLYFVVDQNLESGSQLDLTMTLPAEITHGSEVFVRASAKWCVSSAEWKTAVHGWRGRGD